MIPKIISVETLILTNKLQEWTAVYFRKILFHNESQYLLVEQQESRKILKAKFIEGELRLITINLEEYTDLQNHFNWLNYEFERSSTTSEEEYWVLGISFNKMVSKDSTVSEFKISNEKPLDILPYILRTGDGHVFFSK
ncbi:hypothetical protein B1748_05075 [Paenibacillus sp. MY03]|jgi:hypothetical protein|uniref:hypothetical protein n=1 Tax=Paenibacillus sp. MY03 TaxID=302980 RepID=UPI000B3CEFEE|nr:hypothetical protein [Paenibacillus sp. MY03]OUS78136.1 hypothetical protein B1748_05075 [Paenibacillus sp. MY03]